MQSKNFPNIVNITEQLKDRFEQYKKSSEKEYSYEGTEIAKDPETGEYILRSNYFTGAEEISEIFEVGSDGQLKAITESSEWRRLTDDMSELDIQLQEQTSDVSITEMMREADSMQVILGENAPKTSESLRGEKSDGK